MSSFWTVEPIGAALHGKQRRATIVLLTTVLTTMSWKYFGSPAFYENHLAGLWDPWREPAFSAAAYSFLAAFVLLGLVPAAVVKWILGERLADYGVGLGHRIRTVRSFLLCAPVFLLIAFFASQDPVYREFYPINKAIGPSGTRFVQHAGLYLLFYLGYEFQFRGFLQFGLRESLGQTNALLVQVLASVLMHIGKPTGEAFGAIPVGLWWGVLAFRTDSILSGALQHFLLGVALDWFICHPVGP